MKTRIKLSSLDTFFSALIILLPFLYQFKGFGKVVSLGEVVLLPFIVLYSIQTITKFNIKQINTPLLFFYIAITIMTVCNCFYQYFSFEAAGTIFLRLLYYMLLVYFARSHFKMETVKGFYNFCVVIASVYLIIQFTVYRVQGVMLPIYIKQEWQFPPEARPLDYYRLGYRPSSLFLEPSYYALFVLPAICINLFSEKKTVFNLVAIFLISCGLVLSTSSAGVIGLGFLFIFKAIRNQKRISIKRFILNGMMILVCALGIIYILNSPNSLMLRGRLSSGGSIGERIARGFIVYNKLPINHKLFGVGIGNMESYMIYNNISTIYDESNLNNCASIVQTLVYSGVIGFIFLCFFIISTIKRSEGEIGFPLALLFIFFLSYDNILYYYKFAFVYILLEAINRKEQKNRPRKKMNISS